jgi:hypothetical protein
VHTAVLLILNVESAIKGMSFGFACFLNRTRTHFFPDSVVVILVSVMKRPNISMNSNSCLRKEATGRMQQTRTKTTIGTGERERAMEREREKTIGVTGRLE